MFKTESSLILKTQEIEKLSRNVSVIDKNLGNLIMIPDYVFWKWFLFPLTLFFAMFYSYCCTFIAVLYV